MAHSLDLLAPRAALVAIAQAFYARGWMAGTAGNLSARADNEHFWITASAKPKGRLDEGDFLLIRIADGAVAENVVAGNKPSAETAIHRALYQLFPEAQACVHGHSVDACLATATATADALPLPALEMLKGFGIWEENPRVALPVFANTLDVAAIAQAISQRFRAQPPPLSALMIRGHGATVWGATPQQAFDRAECLEFIFSYIARGGGVGR